jgi:dihydrofolate reductase
MALLKLYSAMSLDGFIAKSDGDVSWLEEFPQPAEPTDYGYADFYASIGTTLMGNATCRFVQNYGGPFPYPDRQNFVFTRNSRLTDTEYVRYVSEDPATFVAGLKARETADIWLVGGGQINTACWNAGLIDELILTVMPIVLGTGIPLLAPPADTGKLRLRDHRVYPNGVVSLTYVKP